MKFRRYHQVRSFGEITEEKKRSPLNSQCIQKQTTEKIEWSDIVQSISYSNKISRDIKPSLQPLNKFQNDWKMILSLEQTLFARTLNLLYRTLTDWRG